MQRYNFFMIYQTFPPYLYIVREINKDGTQRCLTLLRPFCALFEDRCLGIPNLFPRIFSSKLFQKKVRNTTRHPHLRM